MDAPLTLPPLWRTERALGRASLRDFVEMAWHVVDPATFVPGPHIDVVCAHLEAVSRGECRRLLVNLPPGTSKSLILSVLWPAWDWVSHPSRKFICASHDAKLAHKSAKLMRDLVQSSWYQDRWGATHHGPVLSRENELQVGAFKNNYGGFRFSTGVGSGFIGWHADIHIVDDPTKDVRGTAAQVAQALEKTYAWYRETLSTRAVNRSRLARVVVMQRLHQHDLSGRLLAEGGYDHLCLPLEFSPRSADPKVVLPSKTPYGGDWRQHEGELLCPARCSAEDAAKLKAELGGAGYAAQANQQPAAEGGSIIARAWLTKTWKELPRGGTFLQSWDMAFKQTDTSSYVVGQCWYCAGGEYYLVDQVRAQMGFGATLSAIQAFSQKHPHARAKLVEAKANGPAVVDVLGKAVSGLILLEPEGGKESRLHAVAPLFEAGNVYLPHGVRWVSDYIEELTSFPGTLHDDQVDATSQALTYASLRKSRLHEAMQIVQETGLTL